MAQLLQNIFQTSHKTCIQWFLFSFVETIQVEDALSSLAVNKEPVIMWQHHSSLLFRGINKPKGSRHFPVPVCEHCESHFYTQQLLTSHCSPGSKTELFQLWEIGRRGSRGFSFPTGPVWRVFLGHLNATPAAVVQPGQVKVLLCEFG